MKGGKHMKKNKKLLLKEIRTALNEWEIMVNKMGYENKYTDSLIKDLPELVKKLKKYK